MKLLKNNSFYIVIPSNFSRLFQLNSTDRLRPKVIRDQYGYHLEIVIHRFSSPFSRPRKTYLVYLPGRLVKVLGWHKGDELCELLTSSGNIEILNVDKPILKPKLIIQSESLDMADIPQIPSMEVDKLTPALCQSDLNSKDQEYLDNLAQSHDIPEKPLKMPKKTSSEHLRELKRQMEIKRAGWY